MMKSFCGNEVPTKYHRTNELKAFNDTKEGVKGLFDAGISEIPRIFCHPHDEYSIKQYLLFRGSLVYQYSHRPQSSPRSN
ncbi:hypothetical protein RchiOBHm_Chr4g0392061 [Rosa chinensis]|uniref:Uncharacterized protein n=1 Tax=Rosa chinensis TaxID=74649 RepID=A0A2P6QQM6_ROSCH|nr:hypothetical protein RchiOBHm_Chr4g0392061 [Rosa chinensis]